MKYYNLENPGPIYGIRESVVLLFGEFAGIFGHKGERIRQQCKDYAESAKERRLEKREQKIKKSLDVSVEDSVF